MTYPKYPTTKQQCIRYAEHLSKLHEEDLIPIYIPATGYYAAIRPIEWEDYKSGGAVKLN